MMRSVFRTLQGKWNDVKSRLLLTESKSSEYMEEVKIRNSEGQQKDDRVNHMIVADNCYLVIF